jgi:hypothetical protein
MLNERIKSPLKKHSCAASTAFYCIGIADPGTGEAGGFFFTREQLQELVNKNLLIKKKVWLEHGDDTKKTIGEIAYSWMDADAGLMIVLKLYNNILISKVVVSWIKNGSRIGISLGYDAVVEEKHGKTHVRSLKVNEVSIVSKPFHKTCKIY